MLGVADPGSAGGLEGGVPALNAVYRLCVGLDLTSAGGGTGAS